MNSGILDIQRLRLKNYLKSELMEQCTDPLAMIEQPFDYIAVVDFEATCEKNVSNYVHEIIEFPIVLVDVKQRTIVNKFFFSHRTSNFIMHLSGRSISILLST